MFEGKIVRNNVSGPVRGRVLMLLKGDMTLPSSRVTGYQYLPHFAREGVLLTLIAVSELSRLERLSVLPVAMLMHDVTVLQKIVPGAWLQYMLKVCAKRIVFSFDDAIYLAGPNRPTSVGGKYEVRLKQILTLSDHVVIYNPELDAYTSPFNEKRTLLTSPFDMDRFRIKNIQTEGPVVLGWVGTPDNLCYVEALEEVLIRVITAMNGRAIIRIVSSRQANFKQLKADFVPWSLESEQDALLGFDVGIMPLVDNPWTRAKCGYKALLCMAVGLPVVCSPVGTITHTIVHGINGFLARTNDEWFSVLLRLCEEPSLRASISRNARESLERFHRTEEQIPQLLSALLGR